MEWEMGSGRWKLGEKLSFGISKSVVRVCGEGRLCIEIQTVEALDEIELHCGCVVWTSLLHLAGTIWADSGRGLV